MLMSDIQDWISILKSVKSNKSRLAKMALICRKFNVKQLKMKVTANIFTEFKSCAKVESARTTGKYLRGETQKHCLQLENTVCDKNGHR
jgi:hypothetical protein